MDAYDLHEARFIQCPLIQSGANATDVFSGPVPAGKVWTVLCANYYPSAAETKTIQIGILSGTGYFFPTRVPQSIALSATLFYPLLTEGMELKLYPGEKLGVYRDSATAGSTMGLIMRFIESDLPFYSYEEPQNKVVRQTFKRGSVYRASGGGISEGGKTGTGIPDGGGGGRGGPKPV